MIPHLGSLPSWTGEKRVALDIETRDDTLTTLGPGVRAGGYITGVSFAIDGGPAHYLPLRHEGGGNYVDPGMPMAYLREQARRFRGDLVGANLQYDLDYLAEEHVVFAPRFFRDVQVSGPLLVQPTMDWSKDKTTGELYLAEQFPLMSLDAQASRAGLPGKAEGKLEVWARERGLDPKKDMWRMPAGLVEEYAIQDVRLPLQLIKRHEREIDEQGLWDVYDLESRLLPVLLKMRRRGVRVDLDKVGEIAEMAKVREVRAMRTVSALSGRQVTVDDINKAEALAPCLEADGHEVPRTPKTKKPSVKADWLRALGTPVAEAIVEARRWNKVRTTFCESIQLRAVRGRIHCTFNQLRQAREDGTTKGVGFGRLSSSDPNLQQQPARDPEIGPLWRSIYLPDEGGTWACLDFSSQEPRWITHYAELVANETECGWPEVTKDAARMAAHLCRTDPAWDNHSMMAGMMYDEYAAEAYRAGDKDAKHLRDNAKTTFLGLVYGMGGGTLCVKLGLPTEMIQVDWAGRQMRRVAGLEGQALLDRFNARVPHVRALAKLASKRAETEGYVRTLLGRRRRFPTHPQTGQPQMGHKALNGLIQGTSADQMKLAMVEADAAGIEPQLQVHDELDLTIYSPREAEALAEIMANVVPCNVPTPVDNEQGPSWGELMKVT